MSEKSGAPPRRPWEMHSVEFSVTYPVSRIHGAGGTRFFYPIGDRKTTYATRDAAMRATHRHVIEEAIKAGMPVPLSVRMEYPDIDAGESDFAALGAGPVRNEAADAPERAARAQETLAKCLAETERERDRIVGAILLAHDDAQTLHRTVTTGLTKALAEHAEKQRAMTEAMRAGAEDRAAVMDGITATLADIARQQAKILSEARKPKPAKPKKWTFKVRRDNHGSIAALDAEQC